MKDRPHENEGGGNNNINRPEHNPEVDHHAGPRIFAASLSDYNSGILHGEWIDAALPCDELETQVQAMLEASPTPGAEEFGIFDFEGFGPWQPDEYECLQNVSMVALGIERHGQAFAHWVALAGTADSEQLERFEDAYLGCYEHLSDYGEQFFDGTGIRRSLEAIPDYLSRYVRLDVEAFVRDLEQGGRISTSRDEHGVYVFSGRV
jgi:antirestriction protein